MVVYFVHCLYNVFLVKKNNQLYHLAIPTLDISDKKPSPIKCTHYIVNHDLSHIATVASHGLANSIQIRVATLQIQSNLKTNQNYGKCFHIMVS